jgi:uncharacterized protein (TIGR00266 family)
MDGGITVKTRLSGGFFNAMLRKLFGGDSLFVNAFINKTDKPLTVVFSQSFMGDIERLDLSKGPICVQRGAYLAHTPGVKMGVHWVGFASWLAGEGLFKLKLSGTGRAFIGAYGGITKKIVYGDFVVDNGHLLAYSPKMKIKLAGRLFNSLKSSEGLVNNIIGNGIIYLQSRSADGLVRYLRDKIRN